jgi:outer membrane protein OmpA-like peptidoglycan-associated protein
MAAACACAAALAAPGAGAQTAAEQAPATWTPRQAQALTALQRAARGSGFVVQRQGDRLHIGAWSDDAFAPNSAELAPPLRALLDEWCDTFGAQAGWRLTITGHALGGGQAEANQRLAQARAAAVQRHLLLRGLRGAVAASGSTAASAPARRGVELLLEDRAP